MSLWRYEHRSQALATRRAFGQRLAAHALVALVLAAGSLGAGMVGYRVTEGMTWLDAFVNASMILSGMGPASEVATAAGKIFAGTYALFSGVVFLALFAVVAAPLIHRLLHGLHLEDPDASGDAT